jgi:hypothetical protein
MTSQVRVTDEQKNRLMIVSGPTQIHVAGTTAQMLEPQEEGEQAEPAAEPAPEPKEGQ